MGKWHDFLARFKRRRAVKQAENYIDISPGANSTEHESPPHSSASRWLSRWRPGVRRDRQIAWLQAGYSEMLTLMRGINDHLHRQEDVQYKLASAIEQLPGSMDSLQSVGKAAEQQVEVLALLRQQLGSSVQHDQQLVESMNRFNQTLGVMNESSRNSGQTVIELIERSRESDKQLREVLERSEKRFVLLTILFLLAVILGVSAILYTSTHPPRQDRTAEPAPLQSDFQAVMTHENSPPKTVVTTHEADTAPPGQAVDANDEKDAQPGFFRWWKRQPKPEPIEEHLP